MNDLNAAAMPESSPVVLAVVQAPAGTTGLHSAALHSKLLCLLLTFLSLLPTRAPAQTDFARPVESIPFPTDTRKSDTSTTASAGDFLTDTRAIGPERVFLESGPPPFSIDTRAGIAAPWQLTGTVTSPSGAGVAGALIRLQRGGRVFWEGTSGRGGGFTAPLLLAQSYTVVASKSGFETTVLNLNGTSGGMAAISLTLRSAPAVLVATEKGRPANSQERGPALPIHDPMDTNRPKLLKLQNGGLAEVTAPLDPQRMTVVITHGWNGNPNAGDQWERFMAYQIQQHYTTAWEPNIVVWDWRRDAASKPLPASPVPRSGITPTIG